MKYKLWPSTKVMRYSMIAFIIILILSILSMGFLGAGLFFIASPILQIIIPDVSSDLNTMSGDWVWPAMIAMPMAWAFGFLIAGRVYLHLEKLDWTHLTVKTSYIVILLIWNVLLWLLILLNVAE